MNATEPLATDAQDENGDAINTRTLLVLEFTEFLEQTTSGEARTFLSTLLNDGRQCNSHIPASTALAMFSGRFCWMSLETPEAFSILSCFHMAFATAKDDSLDAAQSFLKASEGDGLTPEDIEKTTKIVHFLPRQFKQMGKMFAIMSSILGVAFGDESDVAIACRTWPVHLRKHEMSYLAITRDEPNFYLCLCCHVDRCIQLYFEECQSAESPDDVSCSWLSFASLQNLILTKRHNLPLPPPSLAAQFSRKQVQAEGGTVAEVEQLSTDQPSGRNKKQKRGRLVINESINATWKIAKKKLMFFLRLSNSSPRLPGNQIVCLKYHLVGECHDECPHRQSHTNLPRPMATTFDSWVRTTKTELNLT